MSTAYYKDYPGASKHQYGGVSLWSTGQSAHRVKDCGVDMAAGVDSFGLGRWSLLDKIHGQEWSIVEGGGRIPASVEQKGSNVGVEPAKGVLGNQRD